MSGKKGAITLYLTMMLLIELSIVFTVVESARLQACRMLLETAADAGIESFAAGFQRELYEEYGLFFFDGSMGNQTIQTATLESALQNHMEYVLQPTKELGISGSDFCQMTISGITIDELAIATDDDGMVFRNHVIDSVKKSMGETAIERLTSQYEWAMNNVAEGSMYTDMEQQTGKALTELEDDKDAIDREKSQEAQDAKNQKNPAAEVSEIRSMGILDLVYADTSKISQRSISTDVLASHRTLSKGTGLAQYEEGVLSNILFQQYLMSHFTHATSGEQVQEGNLQYQLEYLLTGAGHDVDNLKGVIHRLLLVREGVNFAYLLTDAGKVAEAGSVATMLVGYTGLVPLVEATKYALLLSWAYAESILDVKVLLDGRKVALVKTAENWKSSLLNIGEVATMDTKQMADENGITYEDYLRMLLMIEDQKTLSMRAVDLIELQVRQLTQNADFRMDNCVAVIQATTEVQTETLFLTLLFMREFHGYETRSLKAVRRYAYEEMR